MDTTMFEAMRLELEKIAKTRWQKEMEGGRLGAQEMARLPMSAGLANTPVIGPAATNMARGELWGPSGTDLGGSKSLGQHRRFGGLAAHKDVDLLGGEHTNLKTGPGIVNGKVHVDPTTGTLLRRMTEGPLGKLEAMRTMRKGVPMASPAQPVDSTLYRAAAAHEGGEKGLFHALTQAREPQGPAPLTPEGEALKGLRESMSENRSIIPRKGGKEALEELPGGTMPARMTASHLGGTPNVAESIAAYRDPDAQKVLQKLRGANPDDAFIQSQMREFGHRPDAPMALGGKGNVALEKSLAGYSPQTSPAVVGRLTQAQIGFGHGPNIKSPALGFLHKHLPRAAQWVENISGGRVKPQVEGAMGLLGKAINPALKDPSDLGNLLKGLPSAVRK